MSDQDPAADDDQQQHGDHPHGHHHHDEHAAAGDDEAPRPRKQEQEDAGTDVTEVAPGVIRTQLPVNLPGLGHVNCYVMEDERGIAVVDPGLPGDDSWKALNDRLRRAGYRVEDIHTVVITHSHFDHFGGATRIHDVTGADILTHESFRTAWQRAELDEHDDTDSLELADDEAQERELERIFSERLPWGTPRTRPPEAEIEKFRRMGRFSAEWYRTPEPSIAVKDSQVVRLARREWVAMHTPGHTNDHLCLFDPEHGVMFTGDHVLPTITPHIGGISPQPDPLAEFFSSLDRMREVEGVSVALPAHGHPFADLAGRAKTIVEHHEERLDTIRAATHRVPAGTVTEYMRVLFRERAWGDMAESETYAHLEHLRCLGELQRSDPDGLAHYTPVG